MFDEQGEPLDARDVLDSEELANYQRARRERATVRAAGRKRRRQQRQAEARHIRDRQEREA